MDIARLVLEYIKTLWLPVTILVIYFSLRQEIKRLMTGKVSAKYKDWSVSLEQSEKIIESMKETQREVAEIVRKELTNIPEDEWSGFDYKASRISSALNGLGLNSLEYLIVSHLRYNNGESDISQLIHDLIAPGPTMEAHEFQAKKVQLESAIDSLKAKGIISVRKGRAFKLHPWAEETLKYRDPPK